MVAQTVVDFKGRSWEHDFDSTSDCYSWTTPRVSTDIEVYCTPNFSEDGVIPLQVMNENSDEILIKNIITKHFPSELVALSHALTLVEDSVIVPKYEIDEDVIKDFSLIYDRFDGGMMNKHTNTFGTECTDGFGVELCSITNGEEVEKMLIDATNALNALIKNTKTLNNKEF